VTFHPCDNLGNPGVIDPDRFQIETPPEGEAVVEGKEGGVDHDLPHRRDPPGKGFPDPRGEGRFLFLCRQTPENLDDLDHPVGVGPWEIVQPFPDLPCREVGEEEVGVGVDQPRRDDAPRIVDHLPLEGVEELAGRPHRNDPLPLQHHPPPLDGGGRNRYDP